MALTNIRSGSTSKESSSKSVQRKVEKKLRFYARKSLVMLLGNLSSMDHCKDSTCTDLIRPYPDEVRDTVASLGVKKEISKGLAFSNPSEHKERLKCLSGTMCSNSGAKQALNVVDMDGGIRRLEKWATLHFSFEHHFGRENPGMNYLQEKDIRKRRLRSRQKKLKAYDLSTLSEFLPEPGSVACQQKEEKKLKLNSKSRQKIVEKESKQLRAVLNHPMFQSDPLASIHQHLQSTQPLPETKQEKRSSKTKKGKAKKNRSKLSGPDSMET